MSVNGLPRAQEIVEAAQRLDGQIVRTPLIEQPVLNDRMGARILLKAETLQRMGAFKFRGAYNAISHIDKTQWPGGVTTCSSGNHAQGVAEAARLLGHPAAIVMPRDAPKLKLERTRAAGAEVVTYDRDTEDREAIAAALGEERQAAFIAPYDNPHIIAGQGTVGLEISEDAAARGVEIDTLLAPCGGGGLISGIGLWMQHTSPNTELFAVEPVGFDDLARSLESGRRERNAA